jgi:RimJ/RimL family protein N-acetyltransferase
MKTYHRPFVYESPDFKTMCALVVRDHAIKKEQFVWHVARLVDWKYNLVNFKRRFPGNYAHAAHLWFNYYDELIGFVISEEFNDEFTIIVLDPYTYLYPEMLAWVHFEWGKQYSQLTTCATATHAAYIAALEQAGYTKSGEIEMTRMFDTSQFRDHPHPSAPLRFESMAENGNYENQRLLRRSAWQHVDLDIETEKAICAYIRTSPIYDARFDFVLVDETGTHVSGCEAFIDRANGTAEIERVCTHSDYANKGYARMILNSCLRALHENGIPSAYLSGGYDKTIHLYGTLGHVKEVTRLFYKQEMN